MKRTQWLKHGDHPAVALPKEGHLQSAKGILNCGMLSTPDGAILVREGDWILTDDRGNHHLEIQGDPTLVSRPQHRQEGA